MFISRATVESSEYGRFEVAICIDYETEKYFEEKNTDDIFYIHSERPLALEILYCASLNILPISFYCSGHKYTMIKYSTNRYEKKHNKYRKKDYIDDRVKRDIFLNSDAKVNLKPYQIINVYTQRCRCVKCYDKYGFDGIISLCGIIPLRYNNKKSVPINIQKCTRCDKYFIDAQSMKLYEEEFGELCIEKQTITGLENSNPYNDDWQFNQDSILSQNGYYTRIDEKTRKQILINMIEQGISKAAIISKLSEFIKFRGERCYYAKPIWEADLKFVNDYKIGSQPIVYFR